MYKIMSAHEVRRLIDGLTIPAVEGNSAYAEYQAWLAAGNTPMPADLPPSLTPLEQIRAIEEPSSDDFRKLTRQYLIAALFKEAKAAALANPATASYTDAQIHAYLMAQGKGYAKLYTEEQAIIPLRALIP